MQQMAQDNHRPHDQSSVGYTIEQMMEQTVAGQNLKTIINDNEKWAIFIKGVFRKHFNMDAIQQMRETIQRGFNTGDWGGIAGLTLSKDPEQNTEQNDAADPEQVAMYQRLAMWLQDPIYFERLFEAINNKGFPDSEDLFTDERIVDFINTITDDFV
jgi:hypothetical protein